MKSRERIRLMKKFGLTTEFLARKFGKHSRSIRRVLALQQVEGEWVEQCRREFQPFTNRVSFTWLNDLSSDQILKRCATLPPRSFIFHGFFILDAAGIHYERNEVLRRLHEVANAPVFAYFASELGLGSIGGRLFQDSELGAQGARTAIRILRGEQAGRIPMQTMEAPPPTYDWRELRRWGIDESRLPPGSVIQYRQPTLWGLYRWHIVGVVLFCLLQTALIIGLVTTAPSQWKKFRMRGPAMPAVRKLGWFCFSAAMKCAPRRSPGASPAWPRGRSAVVRRARDRGSRLRRRIP